MKLRVTAAVTMAAFVSTLCWADQISMKNGDRVTGSIVKKDAKTLTIKTDLFGEVTLPWEQVDKITADKPINVVLSDNKTVRATLETEGGKVAVKASDAQRSVAPAEIVALRNDAEQLAYERLLSPGLLDLWAGSASLGFAGTSGNAETSTFTTGLNAARVTRTDKLSLYFNAIKASALINNVNAGTAQAIRGGLAYNRNLSPRIFSNTFNDYEYDRFQNLDLRFVLGTGLGFMAWRSDKGRLDLIGGGAYNRERFDPARPALAFTRTGLDAYYGNDFNYKLNSRTAFYQNFRMFNNLKNTERWRMNFDAGATTQLTKWLTWNIAISDRFLNSPVAGRKKNDFLYTTGFGISFAK